MAPRRRPRRSPGPRRGKRPVPGPRDGGRSPSGRCPERGCRCFGSRSQTARSSTPGSSSRLRSNEVPRLPRPIMPTRTGWASTDPSTGIAWVIARPAAAEQPRKRRRFSRTGPIVASPSGSRRTRWSQLSMLDLSHLNRSSRLRTIRGQVAGPGRGRPWYSGSFVSGLRDGSGRGRNMAKHIFVTGGVVSSLGKGLTCASIGMLLEHRGLAGPAPEVRPVHQRRSGHDEPVPARRGLRARRRHRDRPGPGPLRALHQRAR